MVDPPLSLGETSSFCRWSQERNKPSAFAQWQRGHVPRSIAQCGFGVTAAREAREEAARSEPTGIGSEDEWLLAASAMTGLEADSRLSAQERPGSFWRDLPVGKAP